MTGTYRQEEFVCNYFELHGGTKPPQRLGEYISSPGGPPPGPGVAKPCASMEGCFCQHLVNHEIKIKQRFFCDKAFFSLFLIKNTSI